jgi:dTDP-4-amino-4,6-dideoxy-D-galactose acyltransferase
MIEKLKWDSNFLGFAVGKCTLSSEEDFQKVRELAKSEAFKLVYIFSDATRTDHQSLSPIDTKVVFSKSIRSQDLDTQIPESQDTLESKEFDPDRHSYDEILNLAISSGAYSRFKTDTNFASGTQERLYKAWIDNSINRTIASNTLVIERKDQIAGLITLTCTPGSTGNIGLLAVHPDFRGQNIGSLLIRDCEFICKKNNAQTLYVSTQKNNLTALKFYEKKGFFVSSETFIYHLWI